MFFVLTTARYLITTNPPSPPRPPTLLHQTLHMSLCYVVFANVQEEAIKYVRTHTGRKSDFQIALLII